MTASPRTSNRPRPSCANRTRLPACRANGSLICEPGLMTACGTGLCTPRFKVKAAECVCQLTVRISGTLRHFEGNKTKPSDSSSVDLGSSEGKAESVVKKDSSSGQSKHVVLHRRSVCSYVCPCVCVRRRDNPAMLVTQ